MAILIVLLALAFMWAAFLGAVLLLFRRGSWELERAERDGYIRTEDDAQWN